MALIRKLVGFVQKLFRPESRRTRTNDVTLGETMMDTCTTCGADIRPGSRFCTTCGTRVNTKAADDNGWGAAVRSINSDDQQTSVLTPVSAPEADSLASADRSRGWGDAWGTSQPSTDSPDPASRFISALDSDVKPVEQTDLDSSWSAPAPTTDAENAFSTWNFGHEQPVDDAWKAPSTWGNSQTLEEASPSDELEAVPASDEAEVDAEPVVVEATNITEADEQSEVPVAAPATIEIPEDDPRHRVMALLGELQELVPQIAVILTDEGTAAMTLTEASLKAGDYADLVEVVTTVRDNPRDIQALGELAGKIDRIETLLQEHAALTEAIESALQDLGSR